MGRCIGALRTEWCDFFKPVLAFFIRISLFFTSIFFPNKFERFFFHFCLAFVKCITFTEVLLINLTFILTNKHSLHTAHTYSLNPIMPSNLCEHLLRNETNARKKRRKKNNERKRLNINNSALAARKPETKKMNERTKRIEFFFFVCEIVLNCDVNLHGGALMLNMVKNNENILSIHFGIFSPFASFVDAKSSWVCNNLLLNPGNISTMPNIW